MQNAWFRSFFLSSPIQNIVLYKQFNKLNVFYANNFSIELFSKHISRVNFLSVCFVSIDLYTYTYCTKLFRAFYNFIVCTLLVNSEQRTVYTRRLEKENRTMFVASGILMKTSRETQSGIYKCIDWLNYSAIW